LLKACRDAVDEIYLEFYIIRGDSIGRSFAEELMNAAARGVEVFLIYDYIGCFDTSSTYFKQTGTERRQVPAVQPSPIPPGNRLV